jgi:hypothetical protein
MVLCHYVWIYQFVWLYELQQFEYWSKNQSDHYLLIDVYVLFVWVCELHDSVGQWSRSTQNNNYLSICV